MTYYKTTDARATGVHEPLHLQTLARPACMNSSHLQASRAYRVYVMFHRLGFGNPTWHIFGPMVSTRAFIYLAIRGHDMITLGSSRASGEHDTLHRQARARPPSMSYQTKTQTPEESDCMNYYKTTDTRAIGVREPLHFSCEQAVHELLLWQASQLNRAHKLLHRNNLRTCITNVHV